MKKKYLGQFIVDRGSPHKKETKHLFTINTKTFIEYE